MLSEVPTQFTEGLFESLGLGLRHASVYYALLKLGKVSVSRISKETGIPRSTIYELLSDLISKEIVTYVVGQAKAIYMAEPPQKLSKLIEKQIVKTASVKTDLEKYIPYMQSEFSNSVESLPKVMFYQGDDGLATVLYDCFKSKEILAMCIEKYPEINHMDDEPTVIKEFVYELKRRKIRAKEIVQNSQANREYKEMFENDIHEIKLMKDELDINMTHVDKQIYDNKVAYLSWDSKVGVIIEDAALANAERQIFMSLWRKMK
jgi:sugar-specific transcriptional regulator TrmB